jgi:hypothetical protein
MDIQKWVDRMNRIHHEISEAWYDADPFLPEKTANAVSAWAYRAESDWREQVKDVSRKLEPLGYNLYIDDNKLNLETL